MIVKTGRFGQLTVDDSDIIDIPLGMIGFPELRKYCLVDPGDDTLILWFQSLEKPEMSFPLLEPKIFKPDYAARLSGSELRELKLENLGESAVFSVITIPEDLTLMTANLKAPLIINLQARLAKQVILQENEYNIRHEMFKELRAHLVTLESQRRNKAVLEPRVQTETQAGIQEDSHNVMSVRDIPFSKSVKSLGI